MTTRKRIISKEDPRLVLHSMKQSQGMQPRGAIEFMHAVAEQRLWEGLNDERGDPITSFRQFLELPYPNGCGIGVDHARRVVAVPVLGEDKSVESRATWNARRAVILEALGDDEAAAGYRAQVGQHGGLRVQDSNVESCVALGTGSDYTIARLERDARATNDAELMNLAAAVRDGDISAAEARRRAGWETKPAKPKQISVRRDDPQSAARTLIKHMDPDALRVLYAALGEALEGGAA